MAAREIANCNSCGSEVQFQAWTDYEGKLIDFQESAENWCPGCECHKVPFTVTIEREIAQ